MSDRTEVTLAPRAFDTLNDAERQALRRWILTARAAGVDGVQDLTARGWPGAISGAVIGIFIPGDDQAAWLAVGQNGYWAVASRIDGSVSPPVDSLADALAIVYSASLGSASLGSASLGSEWA